MMRLAAYAGASTALAAGVVIHAFNQRPNFYSACVYLSQSNLSLMILTNLALFLVASFIYGLQRICYGPLRPIEVEQLYEKGWFAITETCLAMTIFRDEVGAWFLVMFVALMTGKVWGWVGEGRVEILEQQPPANPRLFHIRLSVSLAMSILYDVWLLSYSVNSVIQQARPNMMVMFLFEFAILSTSSLSTALRYGISLMEAKVVKQQTQALLESRRNEVRTQRLEIIRQREAAAASGEPLSTEAAEEPLPSEDDIEEMDIEPPGWETKGHWVLTLDLMTDFVKLGIYTAFFFILLTFYGLPIHIMRDLFLTARSFIKRLSAFLKYRNATRDMNQRYPDATVEEIQREDTCIICREEMRPWSVTNPAPGAAADAAQQPPVARSPVTSERSRPKKLPCGHVLHLGCLKSWLERQQVCPTCRRPVVDTRPAGAQAPRPADGVQPQIPGQLPLPHGPAAGQQPGANVRGAMINIGPLRLAFGRGQLPDMGAPNQQAFPGVHPGQNPIPPNARVYGFEMGFPAGGPAQAHAQVPQAAPPTGAGNIQAQLRQLEQQIFQEIQSLSVSQQELRVVHQLQAELLRLHQLQPAGQQAGLHSGVAASVPSLQRHEPIPGSVAIQSGSPHLPPGVSIPEGWSLLPLQNLDSLVSPQPASTSQAQSTATDEAAILARAEAVPRTRQSPNSSGSTGTTAVSEGLRESPSDAPAASSTPKPLLASQMPAAGSAVASSSTQEPPLASGALEPNPLSAPQAPSIDTTDDIEDLLPNWSSSFQFPGTRPVESQADEAQAATTASRSDVVTGASTSEASATRPGATRAPTVEDAGDSDDDEDEDEEDEEDDEDDEDDDDE